MPICAGQRKTVANSFGFLIHGDRVDSVAGKVKTCFSRA
jgi:hypothetical protein